MKIKTLFFLSLLVVLAAACSSAPSNPPLIYINVNGESVSGYQGAYCWDGGLSGTLCVDPFPPAFEGQVPLEPGTTIRLELDRPLPDSLTVSLTPELFGDSAAEAELDAGAEVEWTPVVPPGNYVLNVNASWKQGDVTYWFYVNVP